MARERGGGGSVGEGLQRGWNGVGGELILGRELGDSLPISRRMAQSPGRSLREIEFLLAGTTETRGGTGGIAQSGSV